IFTCFYFFFFFSSRRRHTRFDCDWSSDVCSSDLSEKIDDILQSPRAGAILEGFANGTLVEDLCQKCTFIARFDHQAVTMRRQARSEERRVGKECGYRGWR